GGEVLAVFQYRAEPSNNSAGVAAFRRLSRRPHARRLQGGGARLRRAQGVHGPADLPPLDPGGVKARSCWRTATAARRTIRQSRRGWRRLSDRLFGRVRERTLAQPALELVRGQRA